MNRRRGRPSPTEHAILAALEERHRVLTGVEVVQRVADLVGRPMLAATVYTGLNRMVRAGLAEARGTGADRRLRSYHLTDAGAEALLDGTSLLECAAVLIARHAGMIESEWGTFPEPAKLWLTLARVDHGLVAPAEPSDAAQARVLEALRRMLTTSPIAPDGSRPAGPAPGRRGERKAR